MSEERTIQILRIIDLGRGTGLGHLKRTDNLLNQLIFKNKKVQTQYVSRRGEGKIGLLHKPDIIIIDSYKIPQGRIDRLMNIYPEAVHFIIDDFNRLKHYKCDFLLNYNPLSRKLGYSTACHTQRLFGLRYFPISKGLKKARRVTCIRKIKEILVTMGGRDPSNFTEVVCDAFLEGFHDYRFHIVIGPGFSNKNGIINKYKEKQNFIFYQDLNDLTPLFVKIDLAVSSCGITAYELAYLRKPVVLIPISKDQVLNARFFKNNLSFLSLDFDYINHRERFIKELRKKFMALAKNAVLQKKIITETKRHFEAGDNKLADRVAKRLKHKILRRDNPIKIFSPARICKEYDIALKSKKEYEKVRWGSHDGMINRFRLVYKLLAAVRYKNLLDIGCGTGDIFKVINDKEKKYFAYDLNFNMVLYAKKNSNNRVGYFNASSQNIPIRSNSIDVVTLIGVLQNCGVELSEFIKEIKRILKVKGYLLLITKNLGWYRFVEGDLKPEKDHNWFFDYEISGELKNNGFDVIKRSGFLNRNGKLVDIERSHEIFYWAQKT